MRARVVAGGADLPLDGPAGNVAAGFGQTPLVGHSPHLADDPAGGSTARPISRMLDYRLRFVGRVEFSAGAGGRAGFFWFAALGQLVDASRVRVIGIGFQPFGQFRVTRPVFRRMQIALREHVTEQQFVVQLFDQPVGVSPVAAFLNGKYLTVSGAVGGCQDVAQFDGNVFRGGWQRCGFGGQCRRSP